MAPKEPEHNDDIKNAGLERLVLATLFRRFVDEDILDAIGAVELSDVTRQSLAFDFADSTLTRKLWWSWDPNDEAVAQVSKELQDNAYKDVLQRLEERHSIRELLSDVDRVVADMRHDQGEIDVLKADTRRILSKLTAE